MNYIESKENNKIKLIRKLSQRKNREKLGMALIEGLRAVEQALDSQVKIEFIAIDEGEQELAQTFLADSRLAEDQVQLVKSQLFNSLVDTVNSQGILALVKIPDFSLEDLLGENEKKILLLDRVQDPGNLGSLIRTADAAGYDGIILTKGTVDAYSNKVNRAAMGSNLYLPIFSLGLEEIRMIAKECPIYASSLDDQSRAYGQLSYGRSFILALGNEANGLSQEILDMAQARVHIPMFGRAESLNVVAAGSILMFKTLETVNN